MRKRSVYLLLCLTFAAAAGCEKGPPAGPPLAQPHPVQGTITFSGGTPLKGGMIYFVPTEEKSGGKMRYEATSMVDAKGHYTLGLNDHSGAPAGDYKVRIMPRDYMELPGSNSNRIPPKYREAATTPLTATVKEGDNTLNFEVK
jgi:hypothetical protein